MCITTGPDGNIWFAENDGNKIGQLSEIANLLPVRRVREGSTVGTYSTFHDAYAAAVDGDSIELQAVDLSEDLAFTNDTDVSIKGGYDAAFIMSTMMTRIKGSLTIQGGTVTISNLILN